MKSQVGLAGFAPRGRRDETLERAVMQLHRIALAVDVYKRQVPNFVAALILYEQDNSRLPAGYARDRDKNQPSGGGDLETFLGAESQAQIVASLTRQF